MSQRREQRIGDGTPSRSAAPNALNHDHLVTLRSHHPGWRLLAADSAPLVAGFLHHCFLEPNLRSLPEQELIARLDDYLHHLRQRQAQNEDAYPRGSADYLKSWADDDHGWLRRYYPPDSDEPHFDLTPATENAIQWLLGLERRQFIGAESRLKLVFDMLRQILEGTESDPEARIAELERRRAAIDLEMDEIRDGRLVFMDPSQLRERFLQAADTARALLADFRQVEQNFRELDREVRERIATSEGGKAETLDAVFGDRDVIADSDQGRSFRAFWDFLMSPSRQEEFGDYLERVMALEPVVELVPDPRLKRIHHDWLEAGETTQRTVARLSEQLRRYLDDQAWLENRRIMNVIRSLEQHALAVREDPPPGSFMTLDGTAPEVSLPMERPMFSPPATPHIMLNVQVADCADLPVDALFDQVYVDKDRLRHHLRRELQGRPRIRLAELLESYPLEQGLAELVAWLSLAAEEGRGVIDERNPQSATWVDRAGRTRRATFPSVTYVADSGSPSGGH